MMPHQKPQTTVPATQIHASSANKSGNLQPASPGNASGEKDKADNDGANVQNAADDAGRFRMSGSYEHNAASQHSVGLRVAHNFLPELIQTITDGTPDQRGLSPMGLSLLDVACGPGVLTIQILRLLEEWRGKSLPDAAPIHVDGLDVDPVILERARMYAEKSKLDISFYAHDFRQPPQALWGKYDVVFSNEGLHWVGPYLNAAHNGKHVFYKHLPEHLRTEYAAWAANQWRSAMAGIASLLRPGGHALLQFGSSGQLDALYDLMEQILSLPRFQKYNGKIWFPLYYPLAEELPQFVADGGLQIVNIHHWEEPLTEQTPEDVTQFVRGWTEPYFAKVMKQDDVDAFYRILQNSLAKKKGQRIREIKWHRTVVNAVNPPVTER